MIIILIVVVTLARLEQEISCHHLEDGASEGPDVRRRVVVCSDDNLRGAILSSLNLRREVMVRPAAIAHITDLNLNIVADSRSTLKLFLGLA